MAKELYAILDAAAEVRDAEAQGENTAERVGGVLCDLLEYLAGLVTAGNIEVHTSSNGAGFIVRFLNDKGQPVASNYLLPEVSASACGVMSPALLTRLNTAYSQSATNKTNIATNKTDIATRKTEIQELEKRLKGRSTDSNAFTDPFVYLGDFDTLEDVAAEIDRLVTAAATPETKYTGLCVIGVTGTRLFVHTHALHFATLDFVQSIQGPVKTTADGKTLQLSSSKYGILFRRVEKGVPQPWMSYYDQLPEATENHSGLLMDTEKWYFNNMVNYGEVATSATVENYARQKSALKTARPTIFHYFDKAKQQCGLLLSLPAGANVHGQTLFLGTGIYRRSVTFNEASPTGTATSWTSV